MGGIEIIVVSYTTQAYWLQLNERWIPEVNTVYTHPFNYLSLSFSFIELFLLVFIRSLSSIISLIQFILRRDIQKDISLLYQYK